ncbi:MAG: Recombination protein RecR [Parcubacteria group bacterium GW2011_GWB1_55_9]|nr:MAG: Recombination protein RecR [Parcubacteria group bacterium GW2011_GWB1_55_9]
MDHIEELARALARFPGIGPRQGKRFVYYLLAEPAEERARLAELVATLGKDVHRCSECLRFYNGGSAATVCNYCSDKMRDDSLLMIVEKDQDLSAVERAGTYRGRYFVLGGVLTLTGKGAFREKELVRRVEKHLQKGRSLLAPYRDHLKISMLGRGLATGSELEYSDAETLRAALTNRKET